MRQLWLAFLFLLLPILARADTSAVGTNLTAGAILARVQANRATKDFSLKARLFLTRDKTVPVEMRVKNQPDEMRTIYRSGKTQLLVVQPVRGQPRYYLQGEGELTGSQRTRNFLGSHFSYYDLGTPFLQWSDPKLVGDDRLVGRDCYILEVRASGEPYARVKMWIDKEYGGFLRAEAFDENENLVRRFSITSFRRIGEVWIPRGIEIAYVPRAQSLPSQEKSRLEVYEGSYDAQLPVEDFSPALFGAGPVGEGSRR